MTNTFQLEQKQQQQQQLLHHHLSRVACGVVHLPLRSGERFAC